MRHNLFNQIGPFINKAGINLHQRGACRYFSRAATTESMPPTPMIGNLSCNSAESRRITSVLRSCTGRPLNPPPHRYISFRSPANDPA